MSVFSPPRIQTSKMQLPTSWVEDAIPLWPPLFTSPLDFDSALEVRFNYCLSPCRTGRGAKRDTNARIYFWSGEGVQPAPI